MNIVSGITLFVIIWWMVFFCTLPLGIQQEDKRSEGAMPGAPANPNLKRKVAWTFGISIIIWLMIYAAVKADLYSFRR